LSGVFFWHEFGLVSPPSTVFAHSTKNRVLHTTLSTKPARTAAPAGFVTTKSDLAKALQLSRQLVGWHCKRKGNPGSRLDGRYSVAEWRKYFEQFTAADNEEAEAIAAIRARKEMLQAEKAAFLLAVMKGEYVRRPKVKQDLSRMIQSAKTRSFSGVARLATLIRLAPNEAAATEVARADLLDLWRWMEKSEWFQSSNESAGCV
jgi:hypothetical protein